jgi:hypothetical protein
MRAIIQSGIVQLVCAPPDFADPKWGVEFSTAAEMAAEVQLVVNYYEGASAPGPEPPVTTFFKVAKKEDSDGGTP